MISKQYLITGLFMGIIGIAMSLLFRLQLAWPEQPFGIFEVLLGKWAPDGVMDPNVYLALVTIHGTIMEFFVLTPCLSGTITNLLIPFPNGPRKTIVRRPTFSCWKSNDDDNDDFFF